MKELMTIILALILSLSFSECAGSADQAGQKPISEAKSESSDSNVPGAENTGCTVSELGLSRDGMNIYGELYLPAAAAPMPLAILSHGFGATHSVMEGYAKVLAGNGIAVYVYDFTGGSNRSRSDGKTTEMSVLTEAADLAAILDHFRQDERFDSDRIFLMGESQGGFVSTYVAGTRTSDVAGLVALYPAYVLQDDARKRTPDLNDIPETLDLMGMTIGSIYNRDALSFDIYDVMKGYTGRALIIHGTSDSIAPISYSERAAETLPNARLIRIEGANHGFYGKDMDHAARAALEFMKSITEGANETADAQDNAPGNITGGGKELKMIIDDTMVEVAWEDNESVDALKELAANKPITIQLSMYSTFEQVGSLGASLPRNDVQTTTEAGDIVLYSGNQIVVFYGSNSWAYTRLGRITDKTPAELKDLLGNGDTTITIELK